MKTAINKGNTGNLADIYGRFREIPKAERLAAYCAARGYKIEKVVKEVGSGVNDRRPKFQALLADKTISLIVVEHRDRATRFGFHYLRTLLENEGRRIEVINESDGDK